MGRPATSSKRKSSGSAARNESEARLRRQLQHNIDKLEKSEQARTELENRLALYQDVLAHRDQMVNNVEVYSHQHHEEYQEHVNSEMEFMRKSLITAYNLLDEQSNALAEAHLMDAGSTQRIYELGQRGQLAEAGAAHIVQESMAMRRRYHSELENASQLIREQQEMSEAMASHYRQDGLQLREACAQYVNEKEMANKEEMELLKQRLAESSQMHGQRAVALRDERVAEMQSTINDLNASLTRQDDIIAAKDSATRDHFAKVRDMANMAQKKDDEYLWRNNELQVEINHLMKLTENEIASKEWYENRFTDEKTEYRNFRYTELQAFKDREVNIEAVKDELMDENVKLIESNNQLRSRIAELIGARFSTGGDEANIKVIGELNDELHKANQEIHRLQEGIECNPNLTEALVNAEEAEADGWKKLYKTACAERDATIRKNESLKLSLQDAKWAMKSMPASWSTVAPNTAVPTSLSALPPTSLASQTLAPAAKTPSFAVSISTPTRTPKASSSTRSHGFALPHPPSASNAIDNKINSEMDDLREKLRLSEERAQQNYDEMKEYQSWLEQVEEGQQTLKGSNAPEYDPVPDNPPGLWDRKDGKDASVANSDIGQDGKDWVTRISRKEHEKVIVKPWPKCRDLDVWRSNVVRAVCVASGDPDTDAWRRWLTPAQLPNPSL